MTPHETRFDGIRVRYDAAKSYDELLAALLADIGEKPVLLNEIATPTDNWQSYQEMLRQAASSIFAAMRS